MINQRAEIQNGQTSLVRAQTSLAQAEEALEIEREQNKKNVAIIGSLTQQLDNTSMNTTNISTSDDGKDTDAVTAQRAIDYEFEVKFYASGIGFLLVCAEEVVNSDDCSSYHDISRRVFEIAKAHKTYSKLDMTNDVFIRVYAGSGGPNEEDTQWQYVLETGTGNVTNWVGSGQEIDHGGALSYRVRVYVCKKVDATAATAEMSDENTPAKA